MPERITLSRAKGWRMPWNTCRVDRATHWGNPFRVGQSVALDDDSVVAVLTNAQAVDLFRAMLSKPERNYPTNEEIRAALGGHNLACWCKPGSPCHADVLLEIANA